MSSLTIFPTSDGQVAVMPIGSSDELERNATEAELLSVEGFTSSSRRTERLAWRALLRSISSTANVEYLPSGKPQLKNSSYKHLSVSHCRDYVAVALSQSPCGVDIERVDRNFMRISSRYMTDEETMLFADKYWSAVVWCAKEALYKYAGREGVDFKCDISIKSVQQQDSSSWLLVAELFGSEQVELRGEFIDAEHILVFTL